MGPHQGFIYMLLTFKLLKLFPKAVVTAMEHMSLLNRSGIFGGIICNNIVFVYTAVLSIKTAINLVNIHLLFRIILLIQ
jgi:hypothetical protein